MRHVCGHTNHHKTMIHTFFESQSNLNVHPGKRFYIFEKFRRNWRLKLHYMALSCSRRGPLRYVCGQTIYPTPMVCIFLESLTDLDVHLGKRFALFGQNRRNWCSQSWHPKQRNLLDVARTDEFRVPPMTIFFCIFFTCFILRVFWVR